MFDATLHAPPSPPPSESAAHGDALAQAACEACVGSGGWFRYEPALDPAPGQLYLSCVACRGSGRTALARA